MTRKYRPLKPPARPERKALIPALIILSVGAVLTIVAAIGNEEDTDTDGSIKSIYKTLLYIGIGLVGVGIILTGVSCGRQGSYKTKLGKYNRKFGKMFKKNRYKGAHRGKKNYQRVDQDSDTESDN